LYDNPDRFGYGFFFYQFVYYYYFFILLKLLLELITQEVNFFSLAIFYIKNKKLFCPRQSAGNISSVQLTKHQEQSRNWLIMVHVNGK